MKIHPSIFIVGAMLAASVLAGVMFGDGKAEERGRSAFMCHVAGDQSACDVVYEKPCLLIGDAIKLAGCAPKLTEPRKPVALTSNGTPDYFGILEPAQHR